MNKHRYYNTTDSSYTMDAQGHVLGGGESGTFASSDQINRGLASGKLVDKGEVEEENESEERNDDARSVAPSPEDMVTNTGDDTPDEDANKSEESDKATAEPEPKKSTSRRGRAVSEKEQS